MINDSIQDSSSLVIHNTHPRQTRALFVCEALVFAIIASWLLVAAMTVDVEYYDGMDTICNARFLLGLSDVYIPNRAPLMAGLLVPAEYFKQVFQLHPLTVWPHHLTTAILHLLYILATYQGVVRLHGRNWASLLATASSCCTYVFVSYAAFISHDLAPGAILLWMLLTTARFVIDPRFDRWLLLVLLGAVAVLIKQGYAIFWLPVVLVPFVSTALHGTRLHTAAAALAAALASLAVAWITIGWVLASWAPQQSLLLRPFDQIRQTLTMYDGTDVHFPLWVYLRNAFAYGLLPVLLLLPGIALSFRRSSVVRPIAIAWLLLIAIIHIFSLREVRYIAFLAPLTACIIQPALHFLTKSRAATYVLAAILVVDLALVVPEAGRIFGSFYSESQAKRFLRPLLSIHQTKANLLLTTPVLSFSASTINQLPGDRYHHIFHTSKRHLQVLFDINANRIFTIDATDCDKHAADDPDGTVLLYSNGVLVNDTGWVAAPPPQVNIFHQVSGVETTLLLTRTTAHSYSCPLGECRMLELTPGNERIVVLEGIATALSEFVTPVLSIPGTQFRFRLKRFAPPNDNYYHVRLLPSIGMLGDPTAMTIRGFQSMRGK